MMDTEETNVAYYGEFAQEYPLPLFASATNSAPDDRTRRDRKRQLDQDKATHLNGVRVR